MSFSFINKLPLFIFFIFILSCQQGLILSNDRDDADNYIKKNKIERYETIDFFFNEIIDNGSIDYYTAQNIDYNFLDKKINKIKINNYEDNYNSNLPINIVYNQSNIYSVNNKGELLKFDNIKGKLIEKYQLDISFKNKIPVSFSLFKNDFIIGFKSGEVIRLNETGQIIWTFKKYNFLNTPIKVYDKNLIILYPESFIILSPESGDLLFEKKYSSGNIIQSTGGKIVNYYNILYFLLPNSRFEIIDTFLYDDHISNLNTIETNTSLNNLNDNIHIYKNLFMYLDNGNTIHTYDLLNNKFLLTNFSSNIIYNNALIVKNDKYIEFYNIKNGNLFSKINIKKTLKKHSKLIKAISINNKLHLFTSDGTLLIFNSKLEIQKKIDLKISKINKIYTYQGKMFISTEKGFTYII